MRVYWEAGGGDGWVVLIFEFGAGWGWGGLGMV